MIEWKKNVVPKRTPRFLLASVCVITQFVNKISCINFPYNVDDFSFVSIELAAHLLRMESMSDCEIVMSVAILQYKKIKKKILSANRKYVTTKTTIQLSFTTVPA